MKQSPNQTEWIRKTNSYPDIANLTDTAVSKHPFEILLSHSHDRTDDHTCRGCPTDDCGKRIKISNVVRVKNTKQDSDENVGGGLCPCRSEESCRRGWSVRVGVGYPS